jgi:catechol 2,3-dioxygenase-like lactoylglutathione lyase family enzyme
MLGYVTIGARDSETSGKFYDAFFGAFGHERKFADGGWIGYGPKGSDTHSVYVCPPFDGKDASFGNGMMIAFTAKSEDEVKAAHKAGLEAGGSDEGTPGYRPPDKRAWYGAYLRDPTGNKVCVFYRP